MITIVVEDSDVSSHAIMDDHGIVNVIIGFAFSNYPGAPPSCFLSWNVALMVLQIMPMIHFRSVLQT